MTSCALNTSERISLVWGESVRDKGDAEMNTPNQRHAFAWLGHVSSALLTQVKPLQALHAWVLGSLRDHTLGKRQKLVLLFSRHTVMISRMAARISMNINTDRLANIKSSSL